MSLPDDNRLYEIARDAVVRHPAWNVEDREWFVAFREAVEAEGFLPDPGELEASVDRLWSRSRWVMGRMKASEKADALLAEMQVAQDEYDALLRSLGEENIVLVFDSKIVGLLDPIYEIDVRRLESLAGRLLSFLSSIESVLAPYPDIVLGAEGVTGEDVAEKWRKVRDLHRALVEARTESERVERLAARAEARPADPPPPVAVKCSVCGVKPARVGDLCKRCAHASGALPKGKIGEAL